MGFFDRLIGKPSPTSTPSSATPASPAATASPPAPTGGLLPSLAAAREKLDAKDLDGALAIYEQVLAAAGDRPDVLVTISGDLGACGHVEKIPELIAPRYDAGRHGPATGLNLLQAYLAVRDATAAQHTLDLLFSLKRPELEERLWGFSNAIAELIEAQHRGTAAPPSNQSSGLPTDADRVIALVSISKPIWSYGAENVPGVLPPKEGRLRRIAFAQIATPGLADWEARMARPEDDLGRFTRGLPLWLMETLYYSPHYIPIAAIGMVGRRHFALFDAEWAPTHLRQLVDSTEGLDYVFTGTLREQHGDYELTLRLWEVKKFRERKTFTASWTPATADTALSQLHEELRVFLECSTYPAGTAIPCPPPQQPWNWIQQLGTSLNLFLADKGVLPPEQISLPPNLVTGAATHATAGEIASLHYLTTHQRAKKLGIAIPVEKNISLHPSPIIAQARELL